MDDIPGRNTINLYHLEIFRAVAEEGSVSGGAERLSISQPAVSKQVRELERGLGVTLFDRLPRGVRLTEAGELLLGYARRLFAVEAAAERALAEWRGLERGRLAIGASTTIGVYLLPEPLAAFHRRYPGVEVRLEIGNTRAIQDMLLSGEVDIALTEGFAEADGLVVEAFQQDELVAVAPPGHPLLSRPGLTIEELCEEPLVMREAGSGTRAVLERALAARGLSARPAMSLGSTEAIKRAVAAGAGVAIVSRLAVAAETADNRLCVLALSDFAITRPLHLLTAALRRPGAAAQAFLKMLGTGSAPVAHKAPLS